MQTPAIRERMVSGLRNVASELAEKVAAGLGMLELPPPMPRALEQVPAPEVESSPTLSLFARPGDGTVRGRRVAILVADGVDLDGVSAVASHLLAAGAVPRLLGPTIGAVRTSGGEPLAVDVSVEATPSVLYDAVVLPDGTAAAQRLAADGRVLEFVKDQYRHAKPLLVLGAGQGILDKAGIPTTLPDGAADSGLLSGTGDTATAEKFMAALARHRHFERETDPPRV